MSTPYGGNNPQQWGQQPQGGPNPQSGGFPAQGGAGFGGNPQPYGQHGQSGSPGYPHTGPQQQPTFDFGSAGGGGNAPQSTEGRSRKVLLIAGAAVIVILIAIGITGFWKPGFFVTKVFDTTAQQNAIKETLTKSFGTTGIESVTCPPKQEAKAGNVFDCTVKIGGQDKKVSVTVKDDDGNYEISSPK